MAQPEQITALKLLLGITDDSKDTIIDFIINNVSDMIFNYCCIDTMPLGLENVLLKMCVDIYRGESFGQEQKQGLVKSISEGDVNISFSTDADLGAYGQRTFLSDYEAQLNRYRKVRW
jgi:Phage QLRG family, putative DNA packaging.